eukprot:1146372-Pelagomonas_calceolata.AAC.6
MVNCALVHNAHSVCVHAHVHAHTGDAWELGLLVSRACACAGSCRASSSGALGQLPSPAPARRHWGMPAGTRRWARPLRPSPPLYGLRCRKRRWSAPMLLRTAGERRKAVGYLSCPGIHSKPPQAA